MADNADLEGKTLDELREILKNEKVTVEETMRTRSPDFGLIPPEEPGDDAGPISREDALKAVADLENAFLIAQIKATREEQARVIKGIREKTERLQKYGLSEHPPVIRNPQGPRPAGQTAQRRQRETVNVDAVCAECGQTFLVPEWWDQTKPLSCPSCKKERRGKTAVGHTFDGEQNRLKAWEEELRQREEALKSGASAEKSGGKLSKKDRRAQEKADAQAEREARRNT